MGANELGARLVGVMLALGSMLGLYYAVALLRGRRYSALERSVWIFFSSFHQVPAGLRVR